MPEGDTVWLAARRLHAALAGRTLTTAELRVPRWSTAELAGRDVAEVVSRGKHQLLRLDGGWTIHTHLRMDGTWRIHPLGTPRRGGPEHQIRVLLRTAEQEVVGYRIPVIELIRTTAEPEVVGHLGPDLLGEDWDLAEALARLGADPARTVGEALLDQRNLAGIGTLYRAEALFLAGVHPRTPVAAVPDLSRLVERARLMLHHNRERPGQATTGDNRPGRQHWVFERVGRPCRRCGSPIRCETFGPLGRERLSYWCPNCQPVPGTGNG